MAVLDVNNMDQIIYLDQLKNEKQSVELKCQSWRPRQKLIDSTTYNGQISKCQKVFENIGMYERWYDYISLSDIQ